MGNALLPFLRLIALHDNTSNACTTTLQVPLTAVPASESFRTSGRRRGKLFPRKRVSRRVPQLFTETSSHKMHNAIIHRNNVLPTEDVCARLPFIPGQMSHVAFDARRRREGWTPCGAACAGHYFFCRAFSCSELLCQWRIGSRPIVGRSPILECAVNVSNKELPGCFIQ